MFFLALWLRNLPFGSICSQTKYMLDSSAPDANLLMSEEPFLSTQRSSTFWRQGSFLRGAWRVTATNSGMILQICVRICSSLHFSVDILRDSAIAWGLEPHRARYKYLATPQESHVMELVISAGVGVLDNRLTLEIVCTDCLACCRHLYQACLCKTLGNVWTFKVSSILAHWLIL